MANGHKLLGLIVATTLYFPAAGVLWPACATAQEVSAPATDAATLLAEADRLLEQGLQQDQMSQFQEAFESYCA